MTWHDVRDMIRGTVSADPRSRGEHGGRRLSRDRDGTGAIGRALRKLHEPTKEEPLPPDFVALLGELDAADRRNRA
jgi:hypothetical protein